MIGGYVSIAKPKYKAAEAQGQGGAALQGHSHN